ncbi:hypothetical protein U9M48_038558 [Paspalum notatum var. saurae]|uniref:Reverse transcriptase Ty1/copia-type domain-containing protein n=1 Tax=Paspalum notatum var. saurae TaxID=547442 RepID=A0AAQ3UNG6_PASNO
MEDEMRSMDTNKVWDLEEIPKRAKKVGCKWVYKTKRDSRGNIKRYKARLVAKGFTQREGIDYTETFSPVSSKDSFRIIMALVAHFDLELHQMDVKTAFLNGVLNENKSIYGLKQASRQWYLKFDETIRKFGFKEGSKRKFGMPPIEIHLWIETSFKTVFDEAIRKFGFKENDEDNCIYAKFRNGRYIFLVLYVDDILLASSDMDLLLETKSFLCSNYDTKDLGEASYVLGIQIHRDRNRCILGLSQKTHIENILKRYGMQVCNAGPVPIANGDKFRNFQCPKNEYEKELMK